MDRFDLVFAVIDEIRERNLQHKRKGFHAAEATRMMGALHLRDEVDELIDAIDLGDDPTEELADILAVLFHTIRICNAHDDDVIGTAVSKLREVFDVGS